MKKFLPLFLLLLCVSPVCADSFTDSGDNVENRFVQTISYGIDASDFTTFGKEGWLRYKGIEFEKDHIQGQSLEKGLSRNITHYIEPSTGCRLGDIDSTFVAVPPEMSVNILYHYRNDTGHDVNIEDIVLAYSQDDRVSRDMIDSFFEKELGREYEYIPLQFIYSSMWRQRLGVLDIYDGLGTVSAGQEGAKVIERVKVKNPIEIVEVKSEKEEGGVRMNVKVKNNGYEELLDLVFTHGDFERTFNLYFRGEHELEYFLEGDFKDGADLGSFRVRNENRIRVCSVEGTNWGNWFTPWAISVFGRRNDGGWTSGLIFGPAQYGFCFERVPYTMVSEKILLEGGEEQVEEEVVEETIEDGEEVEDDVGVVLGITSEDFVLPKTGLGNEYVLLGALILLVVDVFLWYSVVRKKNEKRNIFTKICTKGCKNLGQRRI